MEDPLTTSALSGTTRMDATRLRFSVEEPSVPHEARTNKRARPARARVRGRMETAEVYGVRIA
jgi:hypothetical protein